MLSKALAGGKPSRLRNSRSNSKGEKRVRESILDARAVIAIDAMIKCRVHHGSFDISRDSERMTPNLRLRGGHLKLKQIASFLALLFVLNNSTVGSQEPIPFVPTTMPVVERMLELAGVRKGDVIYDLGCGDGRILIHAAKKYGTRGVGIDLDPQRVAEAKQKATEEGVSHLLEFRAEDGTQTDISKATVVTLYMFKWFNNAIRSKLEKLKPGSRIVAHDYDIDNWTPTRVVNLEPGKDPDIERHHTLYLWEVNAESPAP